jgi:transaldolase
MRIGIASDHGGYEMKTQMVELLLGIAIAGQVYESYRAVLNSPRWQRILNAGARSQRLLWASTGTKDPQASDTLYVHALAAPFTVNTMPEATLIAFADHGDTGETLFTSDDDASPRPALTWMP